MVFSQVSGGRPLTAQLAPWIVAGEFDTWITAHVDQLTGVMLLVVTGVGFLIHLYSVGYMHGDPGYARFFAYLLIGFWYTRPAAAEAGKKAFIVNRVGDFGFGLGVLWLWTALGTLDYTDVFAKTGDLAPGVATGIALLLFMGACGKSAQLPLHVWLPDAMEGPTPVSALIHAATMVTAGVYLVVRTHPIFEASGTALTVVAVVGIVTAIYAGFSAIGQDDIKRMLAYSTISQLGFMFFGAGMGAYSAAIFLLVAHAFFKALLFLAAGSVMHALPGDETDMMKMGGLRRAMPITAATWVVAWLAMVGIPPLSGFFAKKQVC